MRYLIIGGTSVFGPGLIDRLLRKPETEAVIATKLPSEAGFDRDGLQWRDLDVRSETDVNQIVSSAKADVIFDFATQDSVGYAWKEPIETVDINVAGTINVLNAVRDFSPETRLIIAGSGEEYGRMDFSDIPIREDINPQPNNIYGATKACQTMFAKLYYQAYDMDIIVIRTFYETSVLQDDRYAISSFCRQFAEIKAGLREAVLKTGNLNNIRDFTDVEDLVRAFDLVAEKGKSGEVYNAARGRATALLDIIGILEALTGIRVEIQADSSRFRPMDAPSVVADVRKIEADCGWKAEIPLEKTTEKMLVHWMQAI